VNLDNATIGLIWSSKALDDLTFSFTPTFSQAGGVMFFDPIKFLGKIIETTGIEIKTLAGRRANHITNVYRNYSMTIGSDEIADDFVYNSNGDVIERGNLGTYGIDFLRNFWTANYNYISIKENGIWSDFRRVTKTAATEPLTFLDDLIIYPEFALDLKEEQPILRDDNGKYNL
jgi:hypothetical protein